MPIRLRLGLERYQTDRIRPFGRNPAKFISLEDYDTYDVSQSLFFA